MPSFTEALRVTNDMKRDGVVEDHAVAGAMALAFRIEWAGGRGCAAEA
jgi:hypothetical protein